MKKIILSIAIIGCILTSFSCSSTYKFYQVYNVKPLNPETTIVKTENGLVYEDNNCKIYYSFWSENGNAGFFAYNKTNNILYIDLSKSFFVKNGIAYDYYKNREWKETHTSNTTTSSSSTNAWENFRSYGTVTGYTSKNPTFSYGNASGTLSATYYGIISSSNNTSSLGKSISETINEQQIIAIPPHMKKIIYEYNIEYKLYLNCNLERYPKDKSSIIFNEKNSPLHFGNIITYNLGEGSEDVVIENLFYVDSISNYTDPNIHEYVLIDKKCKNMMEIYEQNPNYKTYEKYFKIQTNSSFYIPYEVTSSKILYKNSKYYWDPKSNAYVTNSSGYIIR